MGEPVDRETSNPLSRWNVFPGSSPGGHHEDVDAAELGEDPRIHRTSFISYLPLQQYLASPGGPPVVPEDREGDNYGEATPPLGQFSGQGLGGYHGTPAEEVFRVSALGRIMGSPSPYSFPSRHTLDVHYNPPATTPTYDSPEFDYPISPHVAPPLPVSLVNITSNEYGGSDLFGSITPANGNPKADRFHTGSQPSSAILDDGYGSSNRWASTFSNSGEAYRSHLAVPMEHGLLLDNDPTPGISRAVNDLGYRDHSGSRPAYRVGTEGITQLPLRPPPIRTDNIGPQSSNKRKRTTTPDERREARRTRHKRSHSLDPGEPIQPTPPITLSARADLRMVEQVQYRCETQKGWNPLPSIDFKVQGEEGINLTDAMNLRFGGPDDRDDLMFTHEGIGNSVSCRIWFAGYPACKPRQIVTTNHKKTRDRITREKLAQDAAKRIKSYLEELKEGKTPFPVRFEDMFLVRLRNVARASWQPELRYRVSPSTSS